MPLIRPLCLLAASLVLSFPVLAGVAPPEVMGTWKEQGATGAFVWTLSPDSITLTPVDAEGKQMDEPHKIDVMFEPVTGGWAIVLLAEDGSALGDGGARLNDGTLEIVLPGVGVHEMTRVDDKKSAAKKPAAKKGAAKK